MQLISVALITILPQDAPKIGSRDYLIRNLPRRFRPYMLIWHIRGGWET